MNAAPLTSAALWSRTLAVTRHALETGALQPIATEARTVPVVGTAFQVRVLGKVALKERRRPAPSSSSEPFNPFANPEPDLVLGDVPPAHVCLLNKFNVVEHHLLLVTRAFEPQDALLTLADFDALSTCLEGLDGLAFYNAGETAGASQRHKHLQLVPPLGPERLRAPVEALLPLLPGPGHVVAAESLPFAHLLAGLGPWGAPGAPPLPGLGHEFFRLRTKAIPPSRRPMMPAVRPAAPRARAVPSEEDAESPAFRSTFASAGASAPSDGLVRASTGAGCSGSAPPSFASSFQETTSPPEYVWSALNTSVSVSVGSGPSEASNSWNWPGSIFPPVQVIFVTALLISPSSVFTGVGSFVLSALTVQPGTGLTDTNAIGWSVGSSMTTLVVEASSRSLGTRNVTFVHEPCSAVPGLTVTWARAGPAVAARATAEAAVTAARRLRAREGRREDTVGFSNGPVIP